MRNNIFFYLNLVILNQKAMDCIRSIAHKWLKTVKFYYFVKMKFSEIIKFIYQIYTKIEAISKKI